MSQNDEPTQKRISQSEFELSRKVTLELRPFIDGMNEVFKKYELQDPKKNFFIGWSDGEFNTLSDMNLFRTSVNK